MAFWDETCRMNSVDALKKILAGEDLATEQKNDQQKVFKFEIPIIMISNRGFDEFLEGLSENEKQGRIFFSF